MNTNPPFSTKVPATTKRFVLGAACLAALVACVVLYACSSPATSSTVAINLQSHGATGYLWSYASSSEGMLKETSHETKAVSDASGADVIDSYVFTAEGSTGDGEVALTFTLARPWSDPDNKEEPQSIVYNFKIDSSKKVTLLSIDGNVTDPPIPTIS